MTKMGTVSLPIYDMTFKALKSYSVFSTFYLIFKPISDFICRFCVAPCGGSCKYLKLSNM